MPHFLIQEVKRSPSEPLRAIFIDETTGFAFIREATTHNKEETAILPEAYVLQPGALSEEKMLISTEETKTANDTSPLDNFLLRDSTETPSNTVLNFIRQLPSNNTSAIGNIQALLNDLVFSLELVTKETLDEILPETFLHFLSADELEAPAINTKKHALLLPIEPALRAVGNKANNIIKQCNDLLMLPKMPLLNEQMDIDNPSFHSASNARKMLARYIASYINDIKKYRDDLHQLKPTFDSLNEDGQDFLNKANTLIEESKTIKIRDTGWQYPLIFLIQKRKDVLKELLTLTDKILNDTYQNILLSMESYYSHINYFITANNNIISTIEQRAKISAELKNRVVLDLEHKLPNAHTFNEPSPSQNNKWPLLSCFIGTLIGFTFTMLVLAPAVAPTIGLTYLATKLTVPGLIILGTISGASLGFFIGIIAKCVFCQNKNTINSVKVFPEGILKKNAYETQHSQRSSPTLSLTSTASVNSKTTGNNIKPLALPTSTTVYYPGNSVHKPLLTSPTRSLTSTPVISPATTFRATITHRN